MAHDVVSFADVEERAPGMHFLRDPLDCENLGVTIVDVEAGWTGVEHDHASNDHEEVYVLVEGEGHLVVDGETVDLSAGDAVRVDPASARQLHADTDALFVVAGAP